MKANEIPFLKFLQSTNQFRIPVYQRTYSWTRDQCRQLWADILAVADDGDVGGHFVGSVVYIEHDEHIVDEVPQLLVIDGQQRMTTMTLLLAALRQKLTTTATESDLTPQKITNYYLLNAEESGEIRYKLVLTQKDEASLKAIVDERTPPAPSSARIVDNYEFFTEQFAAPATDVLKVQRGLRKLMIVQIRLNRSQDDPQRIFESLNSTGLKLSQADLIRNYVLMDLDHAVQSQLYRDYWYPMEQQFGQTEPEGPFDRFMRDYLTLRSPAGAIPRLGDVYAAFKSFVRGAAQGIEAVVADVYRYAAHYVKMTRETEPDPELRDLFATLKTLRVDVAYPFLLRLYDDYAAARLARADFAAILRLIESYVFRRGIVGIPTNTFNKTFATLAQHIVPDHYRQSIEAWLLSLPGRQRFPTDEEFRASLLIRDVYNTRTAFYLLGKLETHGYTEQASLARATIEHIMPQNPNLSPEWQAELGQDWQTVQATYLHTLGNLTLTGHNAELGDRPFAEKRTMEKGYHDSIFRLTKEVNHTEHWTAEAMQDRAARLADRAVQIWTRPVLDPAILAAYGRPGARDLAAAPVPALPPANGTPVNLEAALAAHDSTVRPLFDQVRFGIQHLGPDLTEHPYLSQEVPHGHIAYRAPHTFTDVVLQANQVRICLNMPFATLHDPTALAQDVTGQGYWGGDTKLAIYRDDEVVAALALIRQAYEWQQGHPVPNLNGEVAGPPVRKWDETALFAALAACCTPAGVQAARAVYDLLLRLGAQLRWGIGPWAAVTFRLPIQGKPSSLFSLYEYPVGTGTFAVNFEYLRVGLPAANLVQLATQVRRLPAAAARLQGLEDAGYKKRPLLRIDESLAAPGALGIIQAATEELLTLAATGPA